MEVRRNYSPSAFGVREDHTNVDFGPEPSAEEKRKHIQEEADRLTAALEEQPRKRVQE